MNHTFRSFSFPTWRVWRLFVWLQSLSHQGSLPRGDLCGICVERSLASKLLHRRQLLTALQRLQMFILTSMSQRRYINSPCQVGVFDISVSSANSFILSQERKGKKQYPFFFLVVLLYDSLSIGWLFSAWTALAQLRFPSMAGPFPETEPYLPVSDELPVIKLAARNKTTRLRGSGGGSGGLKPFNVGRETAESRAQLPESKTRG